MEDSANKEILRGNINIIILKALEDGNKYGYEVGKYIEAKAGGDFKLKEPTLYSSLKRLESRNLIESYWSDEDSLGGRRKYFRLTDLGKQICDSKISDWRQSKAVIDKIMDGDKQDDKEQSALKAVMGKKDALAAAADKPSAEASFSDNISGGVKAGSRLSRMGRVFPGEDEEINPEYRTILSKLLRNVKDEIDLSIKEDEEINKLGASGLSLHSQEKDSQTGEKGRSIENGSLTVLSAENSEGFENSRNNEGEESSSMRSDENNFSLLPSSPEFNGPFAAIRRSMAGQGFSLSPYSTANNPPKRFLLVNRINLLASILLFFVAALQTAAIYYFWEPVINIGLKYYVYILAVMLVIPVLSSLIYLFNPNKRTKKRYNILYSLISSIMFFIVCVLGIFSIALLFDVDVNNTYEMIVKLYIPAIYASNFVVYSIIWAVLYKANCCRY